MRLGKLIVPLVATLFAASLAHADPLSIRDLNPLRSGYELPPALPCAVASGITLNAQLSIGNISLDQRSAHESLQLDGELQRWQISVTKSLSDTLGISIELPYINVSGGHLDNFIESWHHTFGLPNGNRASLPRDRLLIHHSTSSGVDYQRQVSASGIGDITLRAAKALGRGTRFHNALWLSIKLPTGDANKLTGSGATDVALSWSSSQTLTSRITSHSQLSVSALGRGERLAGQQRSVVWSGSLGANYSLTSHWLAAVQLDGHSKVFASDLRALGNALQLSFGPRYKTKRWQAGLLISEDIAVDTAPDVQFQVDVARRF